MFFYVPRDRREASRNLWTLLSSANSLEKIAAVVVLFARTRTRDETNFTIAFVRTREITQAAADTDRNCVGSALAGDCEGCAASTRATWGPGRQCIRPCSRHARWYGNPRGRIHGVFSRSSRCTIVRSRCSSWVVVFSTWNTPTTRSFDVWLIGNMILFLSITS